MKQLWAARFDELDRARPCDVGGTGVAQVWTSDDVYIYIVRRTHLYLEEHVWSVLHARAQSEKTTISELVRQAVRERYIGDLATRRKQCRTLLEFAGRIVKTGKPAKRSGC